MFKKKLMTLGLAAVISASSLCGCSSEKTPEPTQPTSVEIGTGETETQKETENTTTGQTVMGKFDPEDVCKNISINGEIVEFPWTLNKLGDEYTFDEVSNTIEGEGGSAAHLLYNDEPMIIVGIHEEGVVDRDSKINYMIFGLNDGITIYGFDKNTTEQAVVERMGIPDEIDENEIVKMYWYSLKGSYVALNFDVEKGTLNSVHINIEISEQ